MCIICVEVGPHHVVLLESLSRESVRRTSVKRSPKLVSQESEWGPGPKSFPSRSTALIYDLNGDQQIKT